MKKLPSSVRAPGARNVTGYSTIFDLGEFGSTCDNPRCTVHSDRSVAVKAISGGGKCGGRDFSVWRTCQGLFRPMRLIASVSGGKPEDVRLMSLLIGSEMVLDCSRDGIPLSLFLDRIPTRREVADHDEWDDGERVQYPTVAPGITVAATIRNTLPEDVRVSIVFLGRYGAFTPQIDG